MSNTLLARLLAPTVVFGLVVTLHATQAPAPQPAAPQAAPSTQSAEVAGVRNYTRVDSTVACGGALSPEAITALKQAGFTSIINLRAASEPGANVEEEQKLALATGLKYFHLPFSPATPDATKLDDFLKIVGKAENQPVMIHCASGGRVSMFWAAKRVMLDGWSVDKAMAELPALTKNVNDSLRGFILEYLKSHGKRP